MVCGMKNNMTRLPFRHQMVGRLGEHEGRRGFGESRRLKSQAKSDGLKLGMADGCGSDSEADEEASEAQKRLSSCNSMGLSPVSGLGSNTHLSQPSNCASNYKLADPSSMLPEAPGRYVCQSGSRPGTIPVGRNLALSRHNPTSYLDLKVDLGWCYVIRKNPPMLQNDTIKA
jgi:hypothetical protein